MIEIPLNDRDLQMLPPLHAYFKSFWSDTGPDPRSKFYRFMAKTPIIDGVLFRRAHGVEPPGLWCQPPCADAKWAIFSESSATSQALRHSTRFATVPSAVNIGPRSLRLRQNRSAVVVLLATSTL